MEISNSIRTGMFVNSMLKTGIKSNKGAQLMADVGRANIAMSSKPTMTYKPTGRSANVLLKGTHVNIKA